MKFRVSDFIFVDFFLNLTSNKFFPNRFHDIFLFQNKSIFNIFDSQAYPEFSVSNQ